MELEVRVEVEAHGVPLGELAEEVGCHALPFLSVSELVDEPAHGHMHLVPHHIPRGGDGVVPGAVAGDVVEREPERHAPLERREQVEELQPRQAGAPLLVVVRAHVLGDVLEVQRVLLHGELAQRCGRVLVDAPGLAQCRVPHEEVTDGVGPPDDLAQQGVHLIADRLPLVDGVHEEHLVQVLDVHVLAELGEGLLVDNVAGLHHQVVAGVVLRRTAQGQVDLDEGGRALEVGRRWHLAWEELLHALDAP
mmetsp:Transcript_20695/g.65475  ORF Transcript_20695/g.65475 Transcript_20695/m.65475 type:complete len:250 (-) Transcript_20695:1129-1878(-)